MQSEPDCTCRPVISLPMTSPHPDFVLPALDDVWQKTLDWKPTAEQQQVFQQLYQQILTGNQQLNLTRITEPTDFWEKHLWDSLRGIRNLGWVDQNSTVPAQKVIDIGTGAGFPGVPLAIAQPTWSVTLLDSTRKKVQFLQMLVETLQLVNVQPLVERVEAIGHHPQQRESYDLATVRAVAAAPICAEYALPLLKRGGLAILYRGQWTDAEMESLSAATTKLGGKVEAVEKFVTPLTGGERSLLYLRKVEATPKEFPRAIGIPVQKPLG